MTSEQVLRMLTLWLAAALCGCEALSLRQPAPPLPAVYPTRQIWAVAPLRNESGTRVADGLRVADHLARQLENAPNIDVLPVNRVLAAMEAQGLAQIESPEQAMAVLAVIDADALLLGTITAYEPYDPPKLGLALELYQSQTRAPAHGIDLREMTRMGVDPGPGDGIVTRDRDRPINRVSSHLDAADPEVRNLIQRYALRRGKDVPEPEEWRLYRISMDLFTEFASYVMSWRLLQAEADRLAPPAPPARRPSFAS